MARYNGDPKSFFEREAVASLTRIIGRILLYLLLIAVSLWYLAPLFWMFMTSFMPIEQVGVFPVEWIPRRWQLENYTEALRFWDFATTFRNTLFITIVSLVGDIASSTVVAYGFARFRFPYRNTLFLILLATLMLPFAVRLIPVYAVYSEIGWIDTFYPLLVPSFFGNAFYIFICRQFFLGIQQDLLDAAKIDGASEFGIFHTRHCAPGAPGNRRHCHLEFPEQLERFPWPADLFERQRTAYIGDRAIQIPGAAWARRNL